MKMRKINLNRIKNLRVNKISLISFALIFSSLACEKIDVIEVPLPYQEKIVVRGLIETNRTFSGVSFTRTLPLTDSFTIQKAELKDVYAYLKKDVRIFPLHYVKDGLYNTLYPLTVSPDEEYELFARWNGKNIYAKTKIPSVPIVEGIALLTSNSDNYIRAFVRSRPGIVYGATWAVYSGGSLVEEAKSIYKSTFPTDKKDEKLEIRTVTIPPKYMASYYRDKLYIRIYAFDEQFHDYFNTKGLNQPIEDIFTQAGGPVDWNVYGDGIGMFIGTTQILFKVN